MALNLKERIAAIPQAQPYSLSTTVPAPELPETAGGLSLEMQSIARNYLGARGRAGEAILDAARYLAEARAAAKYGEWGVFLEATGTQEDTATRMLAIAERASTDQQYARAISDGRLALTAAFEILNAPAETQRRALESETPTTLTTIRKEKQESKLRTSAEFQPPDLSSFGFSARMIADGRIAIRSEGNLESQHTHAQLNDLIAFWRVYPPIDADLAAAGVVWRYRQDRMYQVMCGDKIGQTGYTAQECLDNQRDMMERTGMLPTAPAAETDGDQHRAILAQIRNEAQALGLGVIWEDDTVILHWPDEDIEQLMGMGYSDALHWLATEGVQQAEARGARVAATEAEIKRLCAICGARYLGIPDLPYPTATRYRIAFADRSGGDYLADEALSKLQAACAARESTTRDTPDHEVSDRAAYDAKEQIDLILIGKAEQAIAESDIDSARDLLSQVQVATYRRDQILATIPAGREITLAFTPDECTALLREAKAFASTELIKKLPTIGQTLILLVQAIKGAMPQTPTSPLS